jgi:isoleucyl-tRNA synthetase
MWMILDAMTRLLAPILTFTSEEIWASMTAISNKLASIHLARFPEVNAEYLDEMLAQQWKTLLAVRGEISKALEIARKNKVVGHSLDARIELSAPEKLEALIDSHREDLKALSIVSRFAVVPRKDMKDPYESSEIEGLTISVTRATGSKCQRCWVYDETVGQDPEHSEICSRCMGNIA